MRTTVTLADDVAAAVDALRRERGIGLSEALNDLARRGLVSGGGARGAYVHAPRDLGLRIDATNIGEVLDLLDQEDEGTRQ